MKKLIVITGGTSGIGKATASRLAKNHVVIVLGCDENELEKTQKDLGVFVMRCDVSSANEVQETFKAIEKEYGVPDVLINNAGIWIEGLLETNNFEAIQKALEVNLFGSIFCTRAVIEKMKERNAGLIINVNSQAGLYPKSERSVYYASKWGLTGFAKSISLELGKSGVRMTSIHPGKVNTKLYERVGITKSMSDALSPEDVAVAIEFVINLPDHIEIPELGMKHQLL